MEAIEQRAIDHAAEVTDGCKDVEFEFIKALKEQRDEDLKAFERFLDKYNLLQNFGHANAWRRFVKDMKGGEE